ncbi:peroxiredoxin [Oleidesulfovibrio sp.]|uniref:peroxiredoxin n=1 Tax=Oleidesulfovibrio sp. TaxID=2909707 RepID=UPI003A8A6D98
MTTTPHSMPQEGTLAPDFALEDKDGNVVTLKSFSGKWLVLYFYPRANTPGCTREGKEFTEMLPRFKALGCEVAGVSPDSLKALCNFAAKQELQVMLLSDKEKDCASAYGVYRMKKSYGKESMGVVRSTFLIDPQGIISRIWSPVKLEGHVQEVLDTLEV